MTVLLWLYCTVFSFVMAGAFLIGILEDAPRGPRDLKTAFRWVCVVFLCLQAVFCLIVLLRLLR